MSKICLHENDPRLSSDPNFEYNMGSFSKIIWNLNKELKKLDKYGDEKIADWVGFSTGIGVDFGFNNRKRFCIHAFESNVLPDYLLNFRRNVKNYVFFGMSQQISDVWSQHGFPTETIDIGVDHNFWKKTDVKKYDEFIILSVTSNNFRSGIYHTINTFVRLAENDKDKYKLIIKDTEDRNKILPIWVDKLKNEGYNIQYICDRWDDSQIRELYSKCHLLSYPVVLGSAGLPILEAASMELPCIVSDILPSNIYPSSEKVKVLQQVSINDAKDFICNELGLPYTFPPGWIDENEAKINILDENDMLDKIIKIKDNYQDYEKLAKKNRKDCIKNWSWKKSAEKLVELLEKY